LPARTIAEKYMPQFQLCKQCRTDACGVPGKEESMSPAQHAPDGKHYHAENQDCRASYPGYLFFVFNG
jgi:hypothetical protein